MGPPEEAQASEGAGDGTDPRDPVALSCPGGRLALGPVGAGGAEGLLGPEAAGGLLGPEGLLGWGR
ncbi:hypothetical protein SALBM311S_05551 [Streptomyces alboniger]